MTWNDIENIIRAIPEETCSGQQPEFLYRLAQQVSRTGEIVEIGTNVGQSTIALSFAQKKKDGSPIHSIDIYEHPDITSNLKQAKVEDFVHRTVMESSKAALKWNKPIELLWLDGDHCFAGTSSDIKSWSRFVVPGGKIALHDYPGHMESDQIWRAVYKHLMRYPLKWRLISDREVGSIIVFERLIDQKSIVKFEQKLTQHIYWIKRNTRSRFFRFFPCISSWVVQKLRGAH